MLAITSNPSSLTLSFSGKIFPKKGITKEMIDKGNLDHPVVRDQFKKTEGHNYEDPHPLPNGDEQSHFVDQKTEDYYHQLLKEREITPSYPPQTSKPNVSASTPEEQHPSHSEPTPEPDFAHKVGHWAKDTTEWLLPDNLGLDWMGDYVGSMFTHIMDPMSLGITAVSALGSAASLYVYSLLNPVKGKKATV